VLGHVFSMPHHRHDVPIAVLTVAPSLDDRDVLLAFEVDGSRLHGVHRRPVRRGDVDAEVERLRTTVADARIAEEAAHGMLPVKRRDRPPVGHAVPAPVHRAASSAIIAVAAYPLVKRRRTLRRNERDGLIC
jgi:hypothetical protein